MKVEKPSRRMTRFEPAEYERVTYPNYGGLIISQLELSDILELVSSPSSSMILEIGIGTGRILLPLSEKGSVLIGVDADPRMVKSVRERIHGASEFSSRDVQLLVAEGEHLPFRPGLFDVVVCIRVLRYFERPWKAVAQMSEVLRPGGRLVLEFANLLRPHSLSQLPLYFRKGEFYPRLFQKRQVERWVSDLGMKVETVRSWHKIPPAVLMALNSPHAVRAVLQLEIVLKKIPPVELLSRSLIMAAVKLRKIPEKHSTKLVAQP